MALSRKKKHPLVPLAFHMLPELAPPHSTMASEELDFCRTKVTMTVAVGPNQLLYSHASHSRQESPSSAVFTVAIAFVWNSWL